LRDGSRDERGDDERQREKTNICFQVSQLGLPWSNASATRKAIGGPRRASKIT
jgi:hypothetical protein